jgi:hypothetical protein
LLIKVCVLGEVFNIDSILVEVVDDIQQQFRRVHPDVEVSKELRPVDGLVFSLFGL